MTTNTDTVSELFGNKELRWYQIAARTQVEQILSRNPTARILVHVPTGAGKTVIGGTIILSDNTKHAIIGDSNKPLRVLFITHKHRLSSQAEKTFAEENSIVTVTLDSLHSSSMSNTNQPTNSSTRVEIYYQSMFVDIPDNIQFDLVIIDEVQIEATTSIQKKLELLGQYPIIGLSATPDRNDGCILKFDEIVHPISREQAVHEGWLAPTRIHSFVDSPTKDKTNILTDILTNYAPQMGNTMIFVKTKKEVANITTVLKNLGYSAIGILSQNNKELDTILNKFSNNEIQFIINCNRINEGVDVSGCTDIILGRQFGSYSQLNQVIGRAARPDSECNIYELINPISANNLDTTVVVGSPEFHRLVYKEKGAWKEQHFSYVSTDLNRQLSGLVDQ